MKRRKDLTKLETITLNVLTGLTMGLAIVMAAFIALATPIELTVRWIYKRLAPPNLGASVLTKLTASRAW